MNKNFMIVSLSVMLVITAILSFLTGGAGDKRLAEAHLLLDNANGKLEALEASSSKEAYRDCVYQIKILQKGYTDLYDMYTKKQEENKW